MERLNEYPVYFLTFITNILSIIMYCPLIPVRVPSTVEVLCKFMDFTLFIVWYTGKFKLKTLVSEVVYWWYFFDNFEDKNSFFSFKSTKSYSPLSILCHCVLSDINLEISTFPIKNKNGEFFAGINIVRNVTRTLELEAKSQELAAIKQNQADELELKSIVGNSKAIQKILKGVKKISKLDTVVYIQGDTGTGKELVARAIHKLSLRADNPFLAINCVALTETLLNSELFGHIKGAFTGADSESIGLFEAADGGTLFLGEIGEMSMGTQVKLLRVLQDGEI